ARGAVVVELSSFQLETCERLRPKAAVLLNLTPDYLDRYADLDAYGAAKLRIAQAMTAEDALVVNSDDAWFEAALARTPPVAAVHKYSVRPGVAGMAGRLTNDALEVMVTGEAGYPVGER